MSKLRQSAKGRECTVRIPNCCNHDNATVILAHLNGGGMGMKQPDMFGAFCCAACHDAVDRRSRTIPYEDARLAHLEGIIRTQQIWLKEGLIKI